MRHGQAARGVRRLEDWRPNSSARPVETQAVLQREVNYFVSHREHRHDQAREKAGAPLGRGAGESLDQPLQGRLRACGQFWTRAGWTDLLRVRVLVKNQDAPLRWN